MASSSNGNPANGGSSLGQLFSSWLSGAATRVVRWLNGLLSSLTSGLLNLVRSLFINIFNGVFSAVRTVFTGGLAALSASIALSVGGMIAAFKNASDAMRDFAKHALSIRAGTGLSYSQSGSLLTRGLAFGMSPSETAGAFGSQNPLMATLRGNNYQSPHYLSGLSREYNGFMSQGPLGTLLGQAFFKARGIPDSVRDIAAISPNKVEAQERWSNGINQRLGVSGSAIKTWAEDLFFAGNKVATIFQLLRLRLGAIIGPQLVSALERVTDFFGRNAGRISSVLERVANALSNLLLRGLEVLLNFLDANAGKIEEWFWKGFTFLLRDVPVAFMRAGAVIGRAMAFILEAFSRGVSWLIERVPMIGDFFNNLTAGLLNSIPQIEQAGKDLVMILGSIADGIRNIINQLRGVTGQEGSGDAGGSGTHGTGKSGSMAVQTGGATIGFLSRALQWLGATGRGIGNRIGLTTGDPNSGGLVNGLFNGWVGWQIASRLAPPALRLGGRLLGAGFQSLLSGGAAGAGAGAGIGGALGNAWRILASPVGQIAILGGAIGSYGYDNIRQFGAQNVTQGGKTMRGYMPSTKQIFQHYAQEWFGIGNGPDRGWGDARNATGSTTTRASAGMPAPRGGEYDRRNPTLEKPTLAGTQNLDQARRDFMIRSHAPNSFAGLLGGGALATNSVLQSGLAALQQNGPQLSNSLANSVAWLNNQSGDLESGANSYAAKFDELIKTMNQVDRSIREGNRQQNDNTKTIGNGLNVLARSMAYAAQDAALAAVR